MNEVIFFSAVSSPRRARLLTLKTSLRLFCVLFLLALAPDSLAQSSATKPGESAPTEAPIVGETIDEDDVLRVDTNLVSIPVTVTETTGRSVATLRLEDFELKVDGKAKPIGEVHRADTPVTLAILFDNSDSLSRAREFEKQAAIRFFQRIVRPIDHAAIYSVSTVPTLARSLTNNVNSLVTTVEQFPEPEGTTALFDAIAAAASYLRPFDTRKVIVIVSDGNDTTSETNFDAAIQQALKAGCQIYAVGTGDIEDARFSNTLAKRRLQVLAAQTGGALYIPQTVEELDYVFERISEDISQQYVLSYFPTDDPADGRYRAIEVSVKARPTLRVRAREGYYATAGGPSSVSPAATTETAAATPRVRPRRAKETTKTQATNKGGRKAAPPQAVEQVASLDPLYAPVGETNASARPNYQSGAQEISIRPKPQDATRQSIQAGPQEQFESVEASRVPVEVDRKEFPSTRTTEIFQPGVKAPANVNAATDASASTYTQTSVSAPASVAASNAPASAPTSRTTLAQPPQVIQTSAVTNSKTETLKTETTTQPTAKEENPPPASGGVLNGKALVLPKPVYTSVARSAGAKGSVTVEVEIDEKGRVTKAKAISGPALLQASAVNAARQARFSPTLLSGQPIKITGLIVYNFM